MNNKRIACCMAALLVCAAVMGGCASDKTQKAESAVPESLNARQESILAEAGLSTNPADLTAKQKSAIAAMDKMLRATEEKYGKAFGYAGYTAQGILEEESMLLYPTDGDKNTDVFTVTRQKDGDNTTYTDTYMNVVVREPYRAYLADSLKSYCDAGQCCVFSTVTETTLTAVPADSSGFCGTTSASNNLFFAADSMTEDAFGTFLTRYEQWLTEQKLYGKYQFVLLESGGVSALTPYNYTDCLKDGGYRCREEIYIKRK